MDHVGYGDAQGQLIGRRGDIREQVRRAAVMGDLQDEDLLTADALIVEDLGGVGGQDDLQVRRAPGLGQHCGQDAHNGAVEGELGLLKEEDARIRKLLDDGPQQADEAQRAIGEVRLILAGGRGAPVLVPCDEMRPPM